MIGKKKEKNQEKQENVVEVNDNILNIISPPGIDFDKMQTSLGENVGRIYIISRYPDRNDYGWLAKLCNLEGTSTTVEFHYTDPDRLISIYDKRIGELKGNEGTLKNESDIARNKKAQEDLKKLVHRLAVEEEPVGYVTCTSGDTKAVGRSYQKSIKQGCGTGMQHQAFKEQTAAWIKGNSTLWYSG